MAGLFGKKHGQNLHRMKFPSFISDDRTILLGILLIYVFFSVQRLELPGMDTEEAYIDKLMISYKGIVLLALILLVMANLAVIIRYFESLETAENIPFLYRWLHFSGSIYDLVDYLSEKEITEITAVGIDFKDNVNLLSRGKIKVTKCENEHEFEKCVDLRSGGVYVTRYDVYYDKYYKSQFLPLIKSHNLTISNTTYFTSRSDRIEIALVTLA